MMIGIEASVDSAWDTILHCCYSYCGCYLCGSLWFVRDRDRIRVRVVDVNYSDDYSDDDGTYDSYHEGRSSSRRNNTSNSNSRRDNKKKSLEESDSQSLVSEAFTD